MSVASASPWAAHGGCVVDGLRGVAQFVKAGKHSTNAQVSNAVSDLSAVLQGGYRIIIGAEEFAEFYEVVARLIPPPRLSDDEVRQLAEGFVCDYVSTCRKIDRESILPPNVGYITNSPKLISGSCMNRGCGTD